jgi:hypothetical protein
MARSAHHAAILRLDLGYALLTIEKMQAEIENLTGDGGRRCCAEFWLCTIDHIQRNERKQTLGILIHIHTTFRKRKHRRSTRPQQTKPRQARNYNLATIHTDLSPPARAEVLLSRVARLGALELSQPAGSFQILGEYPPRVSETRLLNLFKAVRRDVNEQGESCWISEDHQATGTGCVVLGRYPNIFPEDGSEP